MLIIPQNIQSDLIAHAREGLPEEVCGYLTGTDKEVLKQYRLTNMDHSAEHFSFDPAEQFQVMREARKEGHSILAVYHSHPATPARPSEEDIRLALDPNISYIIISMAAEIPDVKSFRIKNSEVEREEIQVI